MELLKFFPQGTDFIWQKTIPLIFFIFKLFKLISDLLSEILMQEALELFLSLKFSDLPLVLMPEFLSELVALALITSSLLKS